MAVQSIMLICGGPSSEHEVSLISASGVVAELAKKFTVSVIGITREGQWNYFPPDTPFVKGVPQPKDTQLLKGEPCRWALESSGGVIAGARHHRADIYFPLIHGTLGEDGKIQSLFEISGVPYVGCSSEAAAVTWNKDFTKRILSHAGVPVADFVSVYGGQKSTEWKPFVRAFADRVGFPVFVKAASQGSSIGTYRTTSGEELNEAVEEALKLDRIVLVERAIQGRELEIAVLGTTPMTLSAPGEIVIKKDTFYSYDAKYVHPDKVEIVIPAKLPQARVEELKELARTTYHVLNCQGLARIDFFMEGQNGAIVVNEVNTLPGFTPISMYPKMLMQAGLSYIKILEGLIESGIAAHAERRARAAAIVAWRP